MKKPWDKHLITSVVAVIVSLGAMGLAGVRFSVADSTQLNVRMNNFEKKIDPLLLSQKETELRVAVMREETTRNSEDIQVMIRVVASMEKSSAVTSAVIVSLTEAVKDLSNNTKTLNKTMSMEMNNTMTAVAVLQSEVSSLSRAVSNSK